MMQKIKSQQAISLADLKLTMEPQATPVEASLASSFPHHKHIPPDIKHHRVPAPDLSFTCSNLLFLIEEIERQVLQQSET